MHRDVFTELQISSPRGYLLLSSVYVHFLKQANVNLGMCLDVNKQMKARWCKLKGNVCGSRTDFYRFEEVNDQQSKDESINIGFDASENK